MCFAVGSEVIAAHRNEMRGRASIHDRRQKNGGSRQGFLRLSLSLAGIAEKSRRQLMGVLVASAVPLDVLRIVPLKSVKKDRCPLDPGATGEAVIV